jgi:hypothetical protein
MPCISTVMQALCFSSLVSCGLLHNQCMLGYLIPYVSGEIVPNSSNYDALFSASQMMASLIELQPIAASIGSDIDIDNLSNHIVSLPRDLRSKHIRIFEVEHANLLAASSQKSLPSFMLLISQPLRSPISMRYRMSGALIKSVILFHVMAHMWQCLIMPYLL